MSKLHKYHLGQEALECLERLVKGELGTAAVSLASPLPDILTNWPYNLFQHDGIGCEAHLKFKGNRAKEAASREVLRLENTHPAPCAQYEPLVEDISAIKAQPDRLDSVSIDRDRMFYA